MACFDWSVALFLYQSAGGRLCTAFLHHSQPGLRLMAEVTISRLEKFDIGKEYGSFEFGDISRQIGT